MIYISFATLTPVWAVRSPAALHSRGKPISTLSRRSFCWAKQGGGAFALRPWLGDTRSPLDGPGGGPRRLGLSARFRLRLRNSTHQYRLLGTYY